jgi:hypothetical protein
MLGDDLSQSVRVAPMNRFHARRIPAAEFTRLQKLLANAKIFRSHPHQLIPQRFVQKEPGCSPETYFDAGFFSALLRSLAIVKCCSRIGSVLDANCLTLGSEPAFASFLNSLTSCL